MIKDSYEAAKVHWSAILADVLLEAEVLPKHVSKLTNITDNEP